MKNPSEDKQVPVQWNRGFTLIELIVVLVIIGIIAGITVPRFTGSFDSIKFRKTMSDLVFFLRETRIRAMSTGKITTVVIDLHKGFCWNADKKTLKLPYKIEMFADKIEVLNDQTKTFTFYPNGTALYEKLGFVCDKLVAVLYVDPLGGLVYYKTNEVMEQVVRYARSKEILSDEEIKKEIDKLKVSDRLTKEAPPDKEGLVDDRSVLGKNNKLPSRE